MGHSQPKIRKRFRGWPRPVVTGGGVLFDGLVAQPIQVVFLPIQPPSRSAAENHTTPPQSEAANMRNMALEWNLGEYLERGLTATADAVLLPMR